MACIMSGRRLQCVVCFAQLFCVTLAMRMAPSSKRNQTSVRPDPLRESESETTSVFDLSYTPPNVFDLTYRDSYTSPAEIEQANKGWGARTAAQCSVARNCGACAQIESTWGSCRWCGDKCFGYDEFSDAVDWGTLRGHCDENAAIYDKPALCNECRNHIAKSWTESIIIRNPTEVTCSEMATLQTCNQPRIARVCEKACAIYSRTSPFGPCMTPSPVTRSFAQQIRDANPQPYDVLLVTEGGSPMISLTHQIIRLTSFSEFSHAIIISQVQPKLMVLESVSNTEETMGEDEPNGVREVALEYGFAHVTKFALLRKRTVCKKNDLKGSTWNVGGESAVTWARNHINIRQNPAAKPYASMDSFLSVGFTWGRSEGYNDKPENEPDAYYCSQLVAYMLYKQGCAFQSSTNLNVDPGEMFDDLAQEDYYMVTAGSSD